MLKSRLIKAAIVAMGMALLIFGAVWAAPFVAPHDSESDGNNWIWQPVEQDYIWEFCSDATSLELDLTLQSSTGQNLDTVLPCANTGNDCTADTNSGKVWNCELTSSWTNGTVWWYPVADGMPDFSAAGSFTTGPNAVSLTGFNASSGLALTLVLPLAAVVGMVYSKRRQ